MKNPWQLLPNKCGLHWSCFMYVVLVKSTSRTLSFHKLITRVCNFAEGGTKTHNQASHVLDQHDCATWVVYVHTLSHYQFVDRETRMCCGAWTVTIVTWKTCGHKTNGMSCHIFERREFTLHVYNQQRVGAMHLWMARKLNIYAQCMWPKSTCASSYMPHVCQKKDMSWRRKVGQQGKCGHQRERRAPTRKTCVPTVPIEIDTDGVPMHTMRKHNVQ